MEKDRAQEHHSNSLEMKIQRAVEFIKMAKVVIIGTGAGMGKDSGLPDFRGNQGFWNNYPPYRDKFDFMECANPQFLEQHPHLFWGFYGHRLGMYRQKNPHDGYRLLREIAQKIAPEENQNFFTFTSNVDGHFQKANYPADKIYQIHGSIHHLQCFKCNLITPNDFIPAVDESEMKCSSLPHCPQCYSVLRPNILMFDDYTWLHQRTSNQQDNYRDFVDKYSKEPKVLIEIGCGTVIPSVRDMMQQLIERFPNARLIRINPDPDTEYQYKMDKLRYVFLPLGALKALKVLIERIK